MREQDPGWAPKAISVLSRATVCRGGNEDSHRIRTSGNHRRRAGPTYADWDSRSSANARVKPVDAACPRRR